MVGIIVAFVAGLVVMDALWAWRMGIPQMLWYRFKTRNKPQPNFFKDES
jgi:hypothetical protein